MQVLPPPETTVSRCRRDIRGYSPGNLLAERLTGLNTYRYVRPHKYVFVDPLRDDPSSQAGSANFSEPSTKENDENMLVIRGDTRVADVYLVSVRKSLLS